MLQRNMKSYENVHSFRPPSKDPRKISDRCLVCENPPRRFVFTQMTAGLEECYRRIRNEDGNKSNACEENAEIEEEIFSPSVGLILAGRYKVIAQVGEGQSSILVKAKDMFHPKKKHVAIKILHASYFSLGPQEASCLLHLKKADTLKVANIAHVLNIFTVGQHFCIVFEFLLPTPLYKYFQMFPFASKVEKIKLIRRIAFQVTQSLAVLSSLNVIHADIKPENILFTNGDKTNVKIIDFGNAIYWVHDEMSLYFGSFELQTVFYRAPEVMFGLPFGPQIDMWSLGCVLAELYLGEPLFLATSKDEILEKMHKLLGPFPLSPFQSGKYFPTFKKFVARVSSVPGNSLSVVNIMKKLGSTDYLFADFIARLLTFDPSLRLTPVEAACHPFLAPECLVGYIVPPGYPTQECSYSPILLTPTTYPHRPRIDEKIKKLHYSELDLLHVGTQASSVDKAANVMKVFPFNYKEEPSLGREGNESLVKNEANVEGGVSMNAVGKGPPIEFGVVVEADGSNTNSGKDDRRESAFNESCSVLITNKISRSLPFPSKARGNSSEEKGSVSSTFQDTTDYSSSAQECEKNHSLNEYCGVFNPQKNTRSCALEDQKGSTFNESNDVQLMGPISVSKVDSRGKNAKTGRKFVLRKASKKIRRRRSEEGGRERRSSVSTDAFSEDDVECRKPCVVRNKSLDSFNDEVMLVDVAQTEDFDRKTRSCNSSKQKTTVIQNLVFDVKASKDDGKVNKDDDKVNKDDVKASKDGDKVNKDDDKVDKDGDKVNKDDDKVNKDDDNVNKDDDTVSKDDDSYEVNKDDDKLNKDDDKVNKDDDNVNKDDDNVNKDDDTVSKDDDSMKNDTKAVQVSAIAEPSHSEQDRVNRTGYTILLDETQERVQKCDQKMKNSSSSEAALEDSIMKTNPKKKKKQKVAGGYSGESGEQRKVRNESGDQRKVGKKSRDGRKVRKESRDESKVGNESGDQRKGSDESGDGRRMRKESEDQGKIGKKDCEDGAMNVEISDECGDLRKVKNKTGDQRKSGDKSGDEKKVIPRESTEYSEDELSPSEDLVIFFKTSPNEAVTSTRNTPTAGSEQIHDKAKKTVDDLHVLTELPNCPISRKPSNFQTISETKQSFSNNGTKRVTSSNKPERSRSTSKRNRKRSSRTKSSNLLSSSMDRSSPSGEESNLVTSTSKQEKLGTNRSNNGTRTQEPKSTKSQSLFESKNSSGEKSMLQTSSIKQGNEASVSSPGSKKPTTPKTTQRKESVFDTPCTAVSSTEDLLPGGVSEMKKFRGSEKRKGNSTDIQRIRNTSKLPLTESKWSLSEEKRNNKLFQRTTSNAHKSSGDNSLKRDTEKLTPRSNTRFLNNKRKDGKLSQNDLLDLEIVSNERPSSHLPRSLELLKSCPRDILTEDVVKPAIRKRKLSYHTANSENNQGQIMSCLESLRDRQSGKIQKFVDEELDGGSCDEVNFFEEVCERTSVTKGGRYATKKRRETMRENAKQNKEIRNFSHEDNSQTFVEEEWNVDSITNEAEDCSSKIDTKQNPQRRFGMERKKELPSRKNTKDHEMKGENIKQNTVIDLDCDDGDLVRLFSNISAGQQDAKVGDPKYYEWSGNEEDYDVLLL